MFRFICGILMRILGYTFSGMGYSNLGQHCRTGGRILITDELKKLDKKNGKN